MFQEDEPGVNGFVEPVITCRVYVLRSRNFMLSSRTMPVKEMLAGL